MFDVVERAGAHHLLSATTLPALISAGDITSISAAQISVSDSSLPAVPLRIAAAVTHGYLPAVRHHLRPTVVMY